jgi:hypothetical protein
LSDDEALDENPQLVAHLERGILPSELQVLYALCLIGEGGREYLARQCIQAIDVLREDPEDSPENHGTDTDALQNPPWRSYRDNLTVELTKLSALILAEDLLKKLDKEKDWAAELLPIFQREVNRFESANPFYHIHASEAHENPRSELRKTQLIKIVLAETKFRILSIESRVYAADLNDADNQVLNCFDHAVVTLKRLWKVENGVPSKYAVEVSKLNLLADLFVLHMPNAFITCYRPLK